MTPSVGPTGYVMPLSQMAETVRESGVTYSEVKFQANVTGWPDAILKNAVDVCAG